MAFNIPHFKRPKSIITSLSIPAVVKRWNSKYFLTTPIFYVNDEPHIGHLYTAVIGDAVKRYQKLKNPNLLIKYMVGTDEHGLKVAKSAESRKTCVKQFCDEISNKYRNLFSLYNIQSDDFVRTTEERHIKAATALWSKIFSNGHIYKDKYSGWYCLADEMFVSDVFLSPKIEENGERFTLNKKPVHYLEEVNYKFKLGNFHDDLLHWLKDGIIKPKIFRNQVYKWIEQINIMPDISVSRPSDRVSWGIPVPGDDSQNIYVWLDALSSYLCSNGYPDKSFKWPPDVQIIGKDILKFHAIFWPAFLMAAGLEPPKLIFCHSHWMINDLKMSKSLGNVVDPFEQSKLFTSDGFRYFLLRTGVPHKNGNFVDGKVYSILNSELAHTLGNLLTRCTSKALNPGEIFPACSKEGFSQINVKSTKILMASIKNLPGAVQTSFEEFNFYKGIDAIMQTLHLTNKFFFDHQPWVHIKYKEKEEYVNTVLFLTMESLRVCGILLQPIIPKIARSVLDKLSIDVSKRNLKDALLNSWDVKDFEPSRLSPENTILFNKLKQAQ